MNAVVGFVTDFADEAVVLPVAAVVLAGLLLSGWQRGALAWAGAVGGTLGTMLGLKILVFACGHLLPLAGLASPSGHTAASAVVYGGMIALIAPPSRINTLLAAFAGGAIAVIFASTRVVLGAHTLPDVLVGAVVGTAGAIALRSFAGTRPRILPTPWLLLAAIATMLVFHGTRLQAETRIRGWALTIWPLSKCRTGPEWKAVPLSRRDGQDRTQP